MGPSVNSSSPPEDLCISNVVVDLLRAWLACYLLLLPLFLLVLHVGYRQKQKQQSPPSHSDVFTFNIIAMEILTIIAAACYSLGIQMGQWVIMRLGDHLFNLGETGQMCIHSLTCVERYLAVVHPITYLRLKKRGGVMIRNVCIATAWILSAGFVSFSVISDIENTDKTSIISVTVASVIIVSFCSISVLCVLIRPGPAEGGRELKRVNQLKRRAFMTMTAILGVLMLRFILLVSAYLVFILKLMEFQLTCLWTMAATWFYLPSSMVLPLMFLHKAGKLPKCQLLRCEQ